MQSFTANLEELKGKRSKQIEGVRMCVLNQQEEFQRIRIDRVVKKKKLSKISKNIKGLRVTSGDWWRKE